MFWWIVLTVATATLFWSRRVVLCGVVWWVIFLLLSWRSKKIVMYFFGVFLAWWAISINLFFLEKRANISIPSVVSAQVVDQRSIDTRVVHLEKGEILLRSKQPLSVWELLSFSSLSFVPAAVPALSLTGVRTPSFLEDDFSFPLRLATKSYLWRASVSAHQVVIHSSSVSSLSFIQNIRHSYKEWVGKVFWSSPTAALLLWLTTGDRSWFSRQVYTSFVESGLVHLLAVSGSNVVYLSLLLWVVLFWLPFYIRILLIWGAIVVYWVLCGADSSVIRAIGMGILWLVATWFGRRTETIHLLKISAWGMLLRNPLLLWYDLWFLLSFGAVRWILLVGRVSDQFFIKKNTFYYKIVTSRLLPTLGATVWVFPVLVLWTWVVSLSSIPINLFVVPLVPMFLLLWGVTLLWWWPSLLTIFLDWLSSWLVALASWWATQWLFFVVGDAVSRLVVVGVYILLLYLGADFFSKKSQKVITERGSYVKSHDER